MESLRVIPMAWTAILCLFVSDLFLGAAPQAELGPRGDKSDPTNNMRVDHSLVISAEPCNL